MYSRVWRIYSYFKNLFLYWKNLFLYWKNLFFYSRHAPLCVSVPDATALAKAFANSPRVCSRRGDRIWQSRGERISPVLQVRPCALSCNRISCAPGAQEMRLQLRAQGSVRPHGHAALARLTYALVLRECIARAVTALLQLCCSSPDMLL